MKIVHVQSGRSLGGIRSVFLRYQSVFEKFGIETTVVLRPRAKVKRFLDKQTDIVEIGYNRRLPLFLQPRAVRKMKRQIAGEDRVILVHKPRDAFLWRKVAPRSKIILVAHNVFRKYLESADVLIAVSDLVATYLRDNNFENVFVIYNFLTSAISDHEIRWRGRIVISAFGNLRRQKGFHYMLLALKNLKKLQIKNGYEVNIYGRGRLKFLLVIMRFIFKLHELTLNKWTNNALVKMKQSDIVVIPSIAESFSLIAIEAMSQGALIISTKCGGPESIITDGVDGILVEKKNPDALCQAIQKVINNPELYSKLREKGRIRAKQFASENMEREIIEVFESLYPINF
jgi:glycosyltransferase involved in cell wall biosynthesis